jgi:predicted transcriptional regulator
MAQVTIYLDSETERKMQKIIKKRRISKSKWIADLIKEKTATTWPETIVELAGAWTDFPTAEEIRKKMGRDIKRESL